MQEWHCFACGSEGMIGNFCSMCGAGKRDYEFTHTEKPRSLTTEEKATNSETWEHINLVMQLLMIMQQELALRAITHDRSKLKAPEVSAFTEMTPKLAATTYGSDEYKQVLAQMKPTLLHHYANNRHHPEFFENGIADMNLIDVLEMFVDWYAATKRHADGDIYKSIEINKERFGLSDQFVQILKNSVKLVERNPFVHYRTQKDIYY